MAVVFALLGKNPLSVLYVYFLEPLIDAYSLQEIVVKATPLVLIAVGLALCYHRQCLEHRRGRTVSHRRSVRLVARGEDPRHGCRSVGAVGNARARRAGRCALRAYPGDCVKTRFGASEILTSLMLVYVADLVLDYLVRGPWRDPKGFNFPTTAAFDDNRDCADPD